MRYPNIKEAVFASRPNRFVAKVMIDGEIHTVHVKNTGRCKELLWDGRTVYLTRTNNVHRKTEYDLVSVLKDREGLPPLIINIDSTAPNDAVAEWLEGSGLFSENCRIKREHTVGRSRFDFYVEDGDRRALIEVKGVTLESEGIVMFPDAPTERGVKHLRELSELVAKGYEAYVIFVIALNDAKYFTPNYKTHREFGESLRYAIGKGVKALAYKCLVKSDSIEIADGVEIKLDYEQN